MLSHCWHSMRTGFVVGGKTDIVAPIIWACTSVAISRMGNSCEVFFFCWGVDVGRVAGRGPERRPVRKEAYLHFSDICDVGLIVNSIFPFSAACWRYFAARVRVRIFIRFGANAH